MWLILIITLAAVAFGAFITYMVIKPHLRFYQTTDAETARKNIELKDKNVELQNQNKILREKKEELIASIYESQEHFNMLQTQASNSAQLVYEQSLAVAQEKFAQSAAEERQKYLDAVQQYQNELDVAMEEGAAAFLANMAETQIKCKELEHKFNSLQAATNAAIAAAKRAEEIKQEADYYKIQLSELDLEEIRILKNITPYLRDQEPLNKVIWKVYYEKPTTDLIGRVVGAGIHTGIYKITNLDNQKCYVGQAVNIADRWKQHIKRGLGAETPTKNKLYPAMIALGVENFSFEIIEECPREKLDEREDYWQEYFKAKEFGYSIK